MKLSNSVFIAQGDSELEYLQVDTPYCRAKIYLQGAQITEFIPCDKPPLLWVSEAEPFLAGKSIRGGIPVCWPWFGTHPSADFPAHGIARTALWRVETINEQADSTRITLSLPPSQMDEKYWAYHSALKIEFILSTQLIVRLSTTNLDNRTINFSQALHSYFPTSAIAQTTVEGLANTPYNQFGQDYRQDEKLIHFTQETDRVHTSTPKTQLIHTPEGIIKVEKENSTSCVVWNPWVEKSKRLSHFYDHEYQHMLCVETANVEDDTVTLQPKQTHTLACIISWQN